MQFIIKAYDGANKLDKRMEVRPRHLAGMQQLGNYVICAGGLLDEEGKMKGSVLIVDSGVESMSLEDANPTSWKAYGRRSKSK